MNKKKAISITLGAMLLSGSLFSGLVYAKQQKPLDPIDRISQLKNSEDILNYKKEIEQINKELAEQVSLRSNSGDDVKITLTFSQFITESQLKEIVEKYDIKPKMVAARFNQDDGKKGTYFVAFEKAEEKEINRVAEKNEATFEGYIELVGDIPREQIDMLSSEEEVFLVDPTADKSLSENPKEKYAPGLFWKIEKHELVK